MELDEVIKRFGFDPTQMGLRHRDWWIVDKRGEQGKVKIGDLCVEARDGGSNSPDPDAFKQPNYRGTVCDSGDITYRYYYFFPLEELTNAKAGQEML